MSTTRPKTSAEEALQRLDKLGLPRPPTRPGPNFLYYDIETAPTLAWVWQQYQTNVVATERDWYALSFAARWMDGKRIFFSSIFQDPAFFPDTTSDRFVVERLHALFDVADITVAHNGDNFDRRKSNARFLANGMTPPSPYLTIDTKKIAQREFSFYSNSLKELGRFLGLGSKTPHHGFDLWRECMAGVPKSWRLMERYNRNDVVLLEDVYKVLRPYAGLPGKPGHPNFGLWIPSDDENPVCSKCGNAEALIKRGFHHSSVSEWQTLQCSVPAGGCGAYTRERLRNATRVGGV